MALRLLCEDSPVSTPEGGRELAELLVPGRLRQAFEPEAEEHVSCFRLLNVPDPFDPPAKALAWRARLFLGLLGHLGVSAIDPVLEQLDEQLVLALEVGVEGAAGETCLGSDFLDARPLQPTAEKHALGRIHQASPGLGLLLLAAEAPRRRDLDSALRHRQNIG